MAKRPGDCCEVMALVLDRGGLETRQVGIQMGHFFSTKSGDTGSSPIVYFKRAKRAKGEPKQQFDDSTYAPLKFCPFCAHEFAKKGGK